MIRYRMWYPYMATKLVLIETTRTDAADGMELREHKLLAWAYRDSQGWWNAEIIRPDGVHEFRLRYQVVGDPLRAVNQYFDEIDRQKFA